MDNASIPPEGTTLVEPGFARGPATLSRHNGKLYLVRTCYEWVCGRWEGFASMEAAEDQPQA